MALINIDCLKYLEGCERVRTIFADIPDNIGLEYDGFYDRNADYKSWTTELISKSLKKSDIFWLCYNSIHELWISSVFNDLLKCGEGWRKIIWSYEFGQYNDSGMTRNYRPLMVVWKTPLNYNGVRVISERMRIGDKRAAGVKVPGDVWEFPRVVGNSKERRSWCPTQLPEMLMWRVLMLSNMWSEEGKASVPLGTVLDLCFGSGTTGIVAERLGIPWIGCEINTRFLANVSV